MELSEPMRSFITAQQRRMDAFENGEYELDDDEGFKCQNCGWRGLTAPANFKDNWEAGDDFVKCPDCDETTVELLDHRIEWFQQFGYEYDDFPENLDSTQIEE